jgi:hypothetical protein
MLVALLPLPPPPCPVGGLPICSVHSCLHVRYLSHLYVAHLLMYSFSFATSPQQGFAVEVQQRKGLRDAMVITSGWKGFPIPGLAWAVPKCQLDLGHD